jgi:hypothetical protein
VLVGSFGTPYAVGWGSSLVSAPASWWADNTFSGPSWYMCPGLVRASYGGPPYSGWLTVIGVMPECCVPQTGNCRNCQPAGDACAASLVRARCLPSAALPGPGPVATTFLLLARLSARLLQLLLSCRRFCSAPQLDVAVEAVSVTPALPSCAGVLSASAGTRARCGHLPSLGAPWRALAAPFAALPEIALRRNLILLWRPSARRRPFRPAPAFPPCRRQIAGDACSRASRRGLALGK